MASVNKSNSHFSCFWLFMSMWCVHMQVCISVDTCVWVHVHTHAHVEAWRWHPESASIDFQLIHWVHAWGWWWGVPVKLRSYLWQLALETHVRVGITGRLPYPHNIYMGSGDANRGPQVSILSNLLSPSSIFPLQSLYLYLLEAYCIGWEFQPGTKQQTVNSLALFLTTAGKLLFHQ